ncbi:hypothetical protein M0802_002072 [Mischocyttarus mexicanus]|nr:hypothetical protein M0802_002072 [Mischocyttarus mexicanus]
MGWNRSQVRIMHNKRKYLYYAIDLLGLSACKVQVTVATETNQPPNQPTNQPTNQLSELASEASVEGNKAILLREAREGVLPLPPSQTAPEEVPG